MKKNDIIRYTGKTHSILEYGKEYKVFSASITGLQLYMATGFVGVAIEDCILVQIG